MTSSLVIRYVPGWSPELSRRMATNLLRCGEEIAVEPSGAEALAQLVGRTRAGQRQGRDRGEPAERVALR